MVGQSLPAGIGRQGTILPILPPSADREFNFDDFV